MDSKAPDLDAKFGVFWIDKELFQAREEGI